MTRALAAEWGRYNINVNAICPGFFPSKMTKVTLDRIGRERARADAARAGWAATRISRAASSSSPPKLRATSPARRSRVDGGCTAV